MTAASEPASGVRLVPTPLEGLWVIEPERRADERGWLGRVHDAADLRGRGLVGEIAQTTISHSESAGTLRGLHLQAAPHEETKVVRCVRGAAWDVAVDLRRGSPSRGRWHAVELTADNARALYIPTSYAHGFQTLTDATDLLYLISSPYVATAARGVRWDDPELAIAWPPAERRIISERDQLLPTLAEIA